jgi:hypothetical protein
MSGNAQLGAPFMLDGVEVILSREQWYGSASQRWYVNFIAQPTATGKRSDAYHEIRARLGDDWITDLTNSERLIDCLRLAGFNEREISDLLTDAHNLRMYAYRLPHADSIISGLRS